MWSVEWLAGCLCLWWEVVNAIQNPILCRTWPVAREYRISLLKCKLHCFSLCLCILYLVCLNMGLLEAEFMDWMAWPWLKPTQFCYMVCFADASWCWLSLWSSFVCSARTRFRWSMMPKRNVELVYLQNFNVTVTYSDNSVLAWNGKCSWKC